MWTIPRFGKLNAVLAAAFWIAAGILRAEPQTENERLLSALALREGMRVADVGAGDGRFTTALAERVGATGHVFATEVDEAELTKVRARVADAGLSSVTAVLGDQKTTGLEPTCCDAILLRLVYHHFTDPKAMRRDLWRALRPGGRIAVIEVPPKPNWRRLQGVPDRGGHGIEVKALLAEMRSTGFVVAEHHESWPAEEGGYCVVFERPAPPAASAIGWQGETGCVPSPSVCVRKTPSCEVRGSSESRTSPRPTGYLATRQTDRTLNRNGRGTHP